MPSKKILITQSNYIPWKGYFDAINTVDEFVIYDDMQFTRRDWRNRNMIKTPTGSQWLTIPVDVKGKYRQKINETMISDEGWGEKHWKTIVHNYSRAKHFDLYRDIFEKIYLGNTSLRLSEVNYAFIAAICSILGIRTSIKWSGDFKLDSERTMRLAKICQELDGTDYYSGPAAKAYMDEAVFEKMNIKVHYFDYSNYPVYDQLYGDFDHHVTILDLLFNEGPDAAKFMKSF